MKITIEIKIKVEIKIICDKTQSILFFDWLEKNGNGFMVNITVLILPPQLFLLSIQLECFY